MIRSSSLRTLVAAASFAVPARVLVAQQSSGALRFDAAATAYAGTVVPLSFESATPIRWATTDPTIAWVDREGRMITGREGHVVVSAVTATDSVARTIVVRQNPAHHVALYVEHDQVAAGGRARVRAMALDGAGHELPDVPVSIAASGGTIEPGQDGVALVGERAGTVTVVAQTGDAAATREVAVVEPEIALQGERGAATRVTIVRAGKASAIAGGTIALLADVERTGATKAERTADVRWAVSDSNVATVSAGGTLAFLKPGRVIVTATVDGVSATQQVDVRANPVVKLVLRDDAESVAVGDSVRLRVEAWGLGGRRVDEPMVAMALIPGSGHATLTADGVFVASEPGTYLVLAVSGTHVDHQAIFVQAHR